MANTTLGERIRIAADKIGGGSELARTVGIARNTVQRWFDGDSDIKSEALHKIAEATGVSVQWLATGEEASFGEALCERIRGLADEHGGVTAFAEMCGIDPERLDYAIHGMRAFTAVQLVSISRRCNVSLEWLLVGGEPDMALSIETYADLAAKYDVDVDDLFPVNMTSEAMHPTIRAGEAIICSKADKHMTASDGIFLLHMGDEYQVKRIQRLPHGKVRIISDNPTYPAFEMEAKDLTIVGRAITILARDL